MATGDSLSSTPSEQVWEQAKSQVKWRRRRPEGTDLYRVVYEYHEQLELEWEEKFEAKYGRYRAVVQQTLYDYLDCGIVWRGCMRAECTSCDHSELIAFSCKKRNFCPSCCAKRAVLFAEHLKENVLRGESVRHVVFSVSKRIRYLFRRDRRLLDLLYLSGWQTLVELVKSSGGVTGKGGAVLSAHSSGEVLNCNPHVHGIALNGYYNEDGTFCEFSIFSDDELELVSRSFAKRLLKKLVRRELVEKEVADSILSQDHTGFSVWIGEKIEATDEERIKFLSRYIERCPISLKKISIEGNSVILRSDNEHVPTKIMSPLEFLAALSANVPNYYESTIRYYGTFSYRVRGKRAKEKKESLAEQSEVECSIEELEQGTRRVSSVWAQCIRKIYEVEPLQCPKCGEEMVIKAAIVDEVEVRRLAIHLEYPEYRPPPPIIPVTDEIVYDDSAYV